MQESRRLAGRESLGDCLHLQLTGVRKRNLVMALETNLEDKSHLPYEMLGAGVDPLANGLQGELEGPALLISSFSTQSSSRKLVLILFNRNSDRGEGRVASCRLL